MSILGDAWLTTVGVLSATLLLFIYFKLKHIYSKFERRGIPYVKPVFLLGSDPGTITGKNSIGICLHKMYKALEGEKMGGCFIGITPHWVIREPEYVNLVFTTHFDSFPDRGFIVDEKVNPLEAHIFLLKGHKWRYLRNKVSPLFTSGKLKYMYEQMYKCSETLVECLDKEANGKDIDLKEVFARFSTDVIGSTAFGLEPESQINPNSKFREMGFKFFDVTLMNHLKFALRFAFPKLVMALKIRTTPKDISDYFLGLIRQVVSFRRQSGTTRNDFIQLALHIQKESEVESETEELESNYMCKSEEKDLYTFEFTDDLLAAQCFVFFLAGFETTSTTFYFTTYTLARHKEIQDKARAEVKKVKKKYGSFSYDALKDLTYLDLIIAETLRLFPAVPWIIRECAKTVTFPNGVTIEKGDRVAIPVIAIQRDPDYFPEPDVFQPERFESSPPKGAYMPFGDGPRICVGKRFAQVELKMTLAKLLDRFTFESSPLDKGIMGFAPSIALAPSHPLLLRIRKNTS